MKKKFSFIFISLLFLVILNWPMCKSAFVMYFYSCYNQLDSVMSDKDVKVEIPGGLCTTQKDWYPFVMTFNDENIKSAIGEDINLTILYNFGAFKDGRSLFYDPGSPYHSAFYGAYVVDNKGNGRFGFDDYGLDLDDIAKIASHDIEDLVLNSIGCRSCKVSFKVDGSPKIVDYISHDDWVLVNSKISSCSPLHKQSNDYRAYIQYGRPPDDYKGEDFPPLELYGRVYYKYFEKIDATIILYIIAPDLNVVEDTDKRVLSRTTIEYK